MRKTVLSIAGDTKMLVTIDLCLPGGCSHWVYEYDIYISHQNRLKVSMTKVEIKG